MESAQGFVGRQAELERLDGVLDALGGGQGRILELVGEPGIGKTSLLAELSERAEEREFLVLTGLAAEFERELPFGLVVDALDGYLEAAQGREIDRLGGELTGELATVFPALREYVEEGTPRLQDERHRAHRAVRTMLEGLAATRPMLLALDDLHWADDASLEVVATLMRRPPEAPVLIALAYRTAQEPAIIGSTQRVAEQGGWLERIEVGPLPSDAAGALLGPDYDRDRAAALVRESGGNPFYLTELARFAGSSNGSANGGPAHAAAEGDVPTAVTEALEHELRDLGDVATTFLRAAAVAGEPFEPDLAAEIAEMSDAEALDTLDELLERGVIRPTDVPRRFLFRHPLVRHAVYDGAPGGWRLAAHGRAAEALARRGAGVVERAVHVEHAATVGDADAVELLADAAAEVAPRAPASAARWLEAALRLLPEHGPMADRRLELLITLTGSLAATGRFREAVDVIADVLELLPEEAIVPRVQLVAACATLKHLLGQHRQAREGLIQHVESVDAAGPEAANLQIELAVDAFYLMDFEPMREWGERALATATPLGEPLLTATATAILCYAETLLGMIEAAERHRAEAAAILDAASDADLAMHLDALSHLGWAEFHLGRFADSHEHLERGMVTSRTTGNIIYLTHFRQGRSASLASFGRLAEARDLCEEIVDAARLSSNYQALSYGLAAVGWWNSLMGDLDDAQASITESLDLAEDFDESALYVYLSGAAAEVAIQAGNPARASELLRGMCGGDELVRLPINWRPLYLELLARAEAEAGEPGRSDAAATLAEEAAAELGLEMGLGHASRARAVAHVAAGDLKAAALSAIEATRADDAAGARLEAARSRLLAGQTLVASGDRDGGIAELIVAEKALGEYGAERLRGIAARELRKLGKRTRAVRQAAPTGTDGLASLTAREREIADLVTDRKTNREIAETLVLSEKTIESHMRNVFAKLGVSKRAEVARAIERETDPA